MTTQTEQKPLPRANMGEVSTSNSEDCLDAQGTFSAP